MQQTYKFRLYPTKEQELKLIATLNKCRFVYNKLVEGLNNQKEISRSKLQHSIVNLKKDFPELNEVYSKVLQYECYRLFSNLRGLSQFKKNGKRVGKLRFKGAGWFKTFVYNQSGFKLVITGRRLAKLHISKIGDIPIRIHRNVKGNIKQLVIKKYSSGKWFVSIRADGLESYKTANNKKVGIDLGTINFVYDSDGNHTDHPRFLSNSLEKLKIEQRKLSQKKKGSKNRQKQKIKIAHLYEKIHNQRDDFLHKLSRKYVDSYGFIAVENLDIRRLIMKSYNPRNMMDASWRRFIQFLSYKAENAGGVVVEVEPGGTTQMCSNCGKERNKELWNRIHKCECGLEIERDYNSAKNILLLGLERAPKSLETEPLSLGQVRSMN